MATRSERRGADGAAAVLQARRGGRRGVSRGIPKGTRDPLSPTMLRERRSYFEQCRLAVKNRVSLPPDTPCSDASNKPSTHFEHPRDRRCGCGISAVPERAADRFRKAFRREFASSLSIPW